MIRNKHDIPQGYGFPLSQAHRSREKRCVFLWTKPINVHF